MTRAPVTPATRFNIGTAASAVAAAVAPLGLTNTGAPTRRHNGVLSTSASRKRTSRCSRSSATSSSGRSVSPLRSHCRAIARRSMFRDPMTIPAGRRLMYMRDLACCANGMAFYSTPSDLVRFALATNSDTVNGELAGGMVMSLMTGRDSGIVIAVT